MEGTRPLIVVTNDDGIDSPGLRAAVDAVVDLGDVVIAAPLKQQSGNGRSFARVSDGRVETREIVTRRGPLPGYAIDANPAPVARWGIEILAPRRPDLLIAGINYGENIGNCITISGTVGAAIEGASLGVPSLAVSLQTEVTEHLNNSEDVDFTAAAYFTRFFAQRLLARRLPPGVDVLKVDVPQDATPDTPWQLTRVSRQPYWESIVVDDGPAGRRLVGYEIRIDHETLEPDSDIHAMVLSRVVAVAPVTLDLTAEGRWEELADILS